MRKIKERKGFTMAELLIVVAIIAVLVAIAIPIFTTQLEKSKEATDEANIRAAYAEVSAAALTEDTSASCYKTASGTWVETVTSTQGNTAAWVSTTNPKIGGQEVDPGASWTITGTSSGVTIAVTPTP